MCALIYHKGKYIVMRECGGLREELALKNLLALGVGDEAAGVQLEQYRTRCLIEIPWLVDATWQPLVK